MFLRIRLAAADAKGQLDFFKGTKWAGKTVRQRVKFNSVLYVVPWVSEPVIKTRLPLVFSSSQSAFLRKTLFLCNNATRKIAFKH